MGCGCTRVVVFGVMMMLLHGNIIVLINKISVNPLRGNQGSRRYRPRLFISELTSPRELS